MKKLMIAILIIGIVGSLFTAMLGIKWSSDYDANKEMIAKLEELSKTLQNEESAAALKELKSLHTGSYVMMIGGLLSLIASALVFKLKKISGAIMLATVVIAAIFSLKSLVATFLLIVAGGLAFRLKPEDKKEAVQLAA